MEKTVSYKRFHFHVFILVSDGEHTTPEMVFTIHLLSTVGQPPSFQVTAPILEVSPGGRVTIGKE